MTMQRWFLAGALALGCGSSGGSHPDGATVETGGTGGAASDADASADRVADAAGLGGTGGKVGGAAGASGGASGTDGGASSCYGPCLEPLLDECSSVGQSCTTAMSGADTVNCYANGVKELFTADGTMGSRRKPNGDLCLTAKFVVGQYTDFSDGEGHAVGRLQDTASSSQFLATCTATGATTKVDLQSTDCFTHRNDATMTCTPGPCTW